MKKPDIYVYQDSGELAPGVYKGSDKGTPCQITVLEVDHDKCQVKILDWPFEDEDLISFSDWQEMEFAYLLQRSTDQPNP